MTVTDALPPCPACAEEYAYEDGALLVCPMCGHEWSPAADEPSEQAEPAAAVVKDAVGNPLADGDDVTIAKDLKVKGGAGIKAGTKVRGIRLLETPVDGHDIAAKVPGAGQMYLKSSVVKKAT
ncbi:zinc ribbon domain-containing protein YjdM [Micrococcus endophyticus]|uniref:zinc ribbon domain-containing protein YjdM n=1 Tax=Micrococcus endophyticus TaxID=455343 RepID=UPI002004A831|nr:zinc ribbon domain-containing protein YjdM [Micrococcus endophyticus]MCK6090746.1 alkylphosphonate utilization protein [Micrococcus endophyticus]